MSRPGERPLSKLPLLEARKTELERCVFCPKLCRSACPVSNEEPRETIIPWGKMSTAYFVARGDIPIEPSTADPAWACTGCFACREACDHQNDVAGTLLAARAALVSHGAGPEGAKRVIQTYPKHEVETHERAKALGGSEGPEALLVGCTYLRRAPEEARDALDAARGLLGKTPRVIGSCCGLPLLLAGERAGFARAAEKLVREVDGAPLLVVDPGCALALRQRYPEAGVTPPAFELIVERGAREVLRKVESGDVRNAVVRYHDPCQLGRGLGVYDAPRTILEKTLGRPPLELEGSRARAVCSGAGGLLPITMPEVSRGIALMRTAGVKETLVTACASSLVRFRSVGADAADVVTFLARAVR